MKYEVRGGVACRLTLADGRVIEFTMDGPLVAMAPAPGQTEKKQTRRGK